MLQIYWIRMKRIHYIDPEKKIFRISSIVVGGINNQLDADLYDLSSYKKWKDKYAYILVRIDEFSRFALVEPLKTKKAKEVKQALEKVLRKHSCYNL